MKSGIKIRNNVIIKKEEKDGIRDPRYLVDGDPDV